MKGKKVFTILICMIILVCCGCKKRIKTIFSDKCKQYNHEMMVIDEKIIQAYKSNRADPNDVSGEDIERLICLKNSVRKSRDIACSIEDKL